MWNSETVKKRDWEWEGEREREREREKERKKVRWRGKLPLTFFRVFGYFCHSNDRLLCQNIIQSHWTETSTSMLRKNSSLPLKISYEHIYVINLTGCEGACLTRIGSHTVWPPEQKFGAENHIHPGNINAYVLAK